VEPKPSFILAVSRANLYIASAASSEIGWLPPLLKQQSQRQDPAGRQGYLDASSTVHILEIPNGQITRAMGDVHRSATPLLAGARQRASIAQAIRDKLTELSPGDKAYFRAALRRLRQAAGRPKSAGTRRWRLQGHQDGDVSPVVAEFHGAVWPRRDGLRRAEAGHLRRRRLHTLELIEDMKRQNVKLIVVEPYFDLKTPQAMPTRSGRKVMCWRRRSVGEKQVTDYIQLFDYDVNLLTAR
jgi:zinc/manganese transport system substrate-binding protein